jgi:MerR family transcriptional regulator/heat shock protein HspR
LYEREGLISPCRTKRSRLYSEEDVERLAMILRLTRELGVNRSGVEIILRLRHKLEVFQQEMEEMMSVLDDDVKRDFVERFKKIFHED